MPSRASLLLVVSLLSGLTACASGPTGQPAAAPTGSQLSNSKHVDDLPNFTGHWEKNFRTSDDFESRLKLYISRLGGRLQPSKRDDTRYDLALPAGSGEVVTGLARFAEEITRLPMLDIKQDVEGINVEREKDFNLRCKYRDRQYVQSTNPFGTEVCGWSQNRLFFNMNMAGGLHISHQFSLSRDGSMLNVTTTVTSDSVGAPLIISNFYNRFNLPDANYDCRQTLTRNKVCTQGKPEP